jgi:hypothetical protein
MLIWVQAYISRVTEVLWPVMQRRGKKVLVLDPRVSGFLGLLAEVSLLKEHGVEQ